MPMVSLTTSASGSGVNVAAIEGRGHMTAGPSWPTSYRDLEFCFGSGWGRATEIAASDGRAWDILKAEFRLDGKVALAGKHKLQGGGEGLLQFLRH